MGKFERQLRDLFSSLQSAWHRHAEAAPAAGRTPAGSRAGSRGPAPHGGGPQGAGSGARRPDGRGRRQASTSRPEAQEAVRDLRNSEAAQKAQATMREFRESETGRKAESTIQEAEAAARAAYLRLRRSMGDR